MNRPSGNPALCPKCSTRSTVLNTTQQPNAILRRRACPACHHRWSTAELPLHEHQQLLALWEAVKKVL